MRIAQETLGWGYTRVQGALKNLGYVIDRATIWSLMLEHGLDPAPTGKKSMSWAEFLQIHWDQIAAADFFTVGVMTLGGLKHYLVLFVMELSTRKVYIAGVSPDPMGIWMKQIALNLTAAFDGFLLGKRILLHARDPLFTDTFRKILSDAGVEPTRLPARSPNLNAFAERFVRSIKSECIERMIFFSKTALERAIFKYADHYHQERNHQGLGNRLLETPSKAAALEGKFLCR